jgi:heptosyltransferase-3
MQRAAAALFTIANLSQMIRAWQSKHRARRYWRPWQAELHPGARVGLAQAGNLGDVVHTLPMAGAIKAGCPTATIVFIGRRYTESLVRASRYVDEFFDAELAKRDADAVAAQKLDILLNPYRWSEITRAAVRARVPVRIGNLRRRNTLLLGCNRFVFYGRARSGLNESALNIRDLRALGLRLEPSNAEMAALAGLSRLEPLAAEHRALFAPGHFHLLLQTKTDGHAREWPLEHFFTLVRLLAAERVQVILSGTAAEGHIVRTACPALLAEPNVTDAFGRFTLPQLLAFIAAADGIVSASTGPVHLAAVLGIHALGIFPGRRSLNGKRWFPLGPKGEALQAVEFCPRNAKCDLCLGGPCQCTISITPQMVYERVMAWSNDRKPLAVQLSSRARTAISNR